MNIFIVMGAALLLFISVYSFAKNGTGSLSQQVTGVNLAILSSSRDNNSIDVLTTLDVTNPQMVNVMLENQTTFEIQEASRRGIRNSIQELYFFVRDQVQKSSSASGKETLTRLYSLMAQAESDAELTKARRQASLFETAEKIQQEIYQLQHPSNCKAARKIVCDFNAGHCGINCELFRLAYCFMFAYYTNRTALLDRDGQIWDYTRSGWSSVFQNISSCSYFQIEKDGDSIVNWVSLGQSNSAKVVFYRYSTDSKQPFLFPALPKKYGSTVFALHTDPFAFYMGQYKKYFMRMTPAMEKHVEEAASKIPFGNGSVVGLQIRRTDKIREAKFYELREYLTWAEDWFKIKEVRFNKKIPRRIFLATDEPSVVQEAQQNGSNYEVFINSQAAQTAKLQRNSDDSLRDIITDIYLLSRCDYLVCTFSSGVCRLAYELMQARLGDAGDNFHSLDWIHFPHHQTVVEPHKAASSEEIDLQVGDRVYLEDNRWNGFLFGTNRRTNARGLFPSYKVVDSWVTF